MKKWAIVALSIILVLLVGVLGTVAYATTDSNGNVQISISDGGSVNIGLEEGSKTGVSLLPGQSASHKIAVENNSNAPFYVWFAYAVPTALEEEVLSITSLTPSVGWAAAATRTQKINGVEYSIYPVYYKNSVEASGNIPSVTPYEISMNSKVDKDSNGNIILVEDGEVTPVSYNVSNGFPGISIYAFASNQFTNAGELEAYISTWTIPQN